MNAIAILDFGSQYAQLIARRVREAGVYCELFAYNASAVEVLELQPRGFILSGGPASVYEPGAPQIPPYVLEKGLPVLGICYGMQALTHTLGGRVSPSAKREYGSAPIEVLADDPLLPERSYQVWMSHGDRIEETPPGFDVLARSPHSPIAVMADRDRQRYGIQFHPEVQHTPRGAEILRHFVLDICGAEPSWHPASIIATSLEKIRAQVGSGHALAGVSGGVDSSVAAALVHQAIGDQLTCIFVNNGLLRVGEAQTVAQTFKHNLGARLIAVDATELFLEQLQGVTDPEEKRRCIGELFIRIFEQQARDLESAQYLVQGTIYPDVVESSGPDRNVAARIKTHHNVGGLPDDMQIELVEPLRYLFKDEVRAVGLELGLPPATVNRQPFPGPGLAVRCLGEVTQARLERLRQADSIVLEELEQAGLLAPSGITAIAGGVADPMRSTIAQAFAVLLPVRSVGVMGDARTYAETVAIRAVTTDDFMTADWARIPDEILAIMSNRIVNEVQEVNRVVYDISSKPPATIEWE